MGSATFLAIIVGWLLFLVAIAIYHNFESRKAVEMGSLKYLYRATDRCGWIMIASSAVPLMAVYFGLFRG